MLNAGANRFQANCTAFPSLKTQLNSRSSRFFFQTKRLVQGTNCQFHVLVIDQHGHLDFRGGNHLNIDALFRQGFEHQAGHAHM